MITSLIEEAEAIGWYEQRMAVEKDKQAKAIMANAQKEEFKHFGMNLEFLLRRNKDGGPSSEAFFSPRVTSLSALRRRKRRSIELVRETSRKLAKPRQGQQLADFCGGLSVVTLALFAAGSVPALSEQSSTCGHGNVVVTRRDPIAIRILFPVGTQLSVRRPIGVCFDLTVGELGQLREGLQRGRVVVSAVDREGRQLLGGGTLLTIANAVAEGHIHLRALFPD
jgi:hypothetical protein